MLTEASSVVAQLVVAVILYIFAYWYSLQFAVSLNDCKTRACNAIHRAHEKCLCNLAPIDFSALRGGQYYIGEMTEEKRKSLRGCAMTFWSASHFCLYFALGFFAPSLFWLTFSTGVAFEFYENMQFDCHDVLDVAYNTAGFIAGRACNRALARVDIVRAPPQ